jgi:tetratricopeptide (TPR) repeat protein
VIALVLSLLLGLADLDRAEQAYHAGRFEEALAGFEAALSEPAAEEGALLYNMGNCAYRLGRLPDAILLYRRAQIHLPRDREVAFNLRLTEAKLGVSPPASPSLTTSAARILDSLTPQEHLALVGALETVGLAGMVLLRRRRAARNATAFLVVLALLGAARLARAIWFPGAPAGVVIAREIALRPEPSTSEPITARLRAGESVRIESMSTEWLRVAHPLGRGWTERVGIGLVD